MATSLPSSLPHEPASKKPKMSTTTTTSDDDTDAAVDLLTGDDLIPPKPRRYKRRKVAIFLAYIGVGYQGMQKNPGAKTIEGDLEEALYHSGAVPETDRGCPKRYDWARSARTDKGVSAVGQVVSGRFYVDPPGFVERMNENLSDQIRVLGYKRVTASFNAKKFCDRRRYVYLLPVFSLDGRAHLDRESVRESVGKGMEIVRCGECSERGRKVVGVMGKRSFLKSGGRLNGNGADVVADCDAEAADFAVERVVTMDVSCGDEGDVDGNGSLNEIGGVVLDGKAEKGLSSNVGSGNVEIPVEGVISEARDVTREEGDADNLDDSNDVLRKMERDEDGNLGSGEGNDERKGVVDEGVMDGCAIDVEKTVKKSEFRYGEEEKERFNRILKHYEGTHNFHNFTTRTKAEDPSARRYIVSFEANTVVTVDGIDFVKCEVVGQSFILHQIRKMMGLAVAIMRNAAPESIFDSAFQQDVNINVPTAPEVGLYLDECFFTSYNNKWKDSHEELSMKAYAKEAEAFKMKHIYSHVAKTEHNEGAVAVWLHSLNHRNYHDLRPLDNDTVIERKADKVDNIGSASAFG